MWTLFVKGGPVMWPLLLTSVIAFTVVFERILFLVKESKQRDEKQVEWFLTQVEQGQMEQALEAGKTSADFVARTLVYGLTHRKQSLSHALMQAANKELKRFERGLAILDTVITVAPLLGLFGTVTGMIHAFGLLGNAGLDAPTAITGGIAEALIATAFGLVIAIVALIPFNFLNTKVDQARHDLEDAATQLELLVLKQGQ